ncbi:uncharacterized protein A4U43_C04F14530 [Asparagus officinalis]|uniref:Uncharacterized protein n=1 Tax=Asparagus officinalis TaxID=4686 RepID=A0A5P1F1C6_ASPOF|nr:uncharacterized protein A4U43_C04F14530 [Asparagus officinalis]
MPKFRTLNSEIEKSEMDVEEAEAELEGKEIECLACQNRVIAPYTIVVIPSEKFEIKYLEVESREAVFMATIG